MSKREIRAERIAVEGDFVRVVQKSMKGIAAAGGAIVGTLVGGPIGALVGALGAVGGKEGEIKLIPKSDVAEISMDPRTGEIRVVIDDDGEKSPADRVPGSAKGMFTVPDDFDAPIADFRDYM